MRVGSIVRIFAEEYSFATKGVDKCCAAWNASLTFEYMLTLERSMSLPVPEAPQTIRQN